MHRDVLPCRLLRFSKPEDPMSVRLVSFHVRHVPVRTAGDNPIRLGQRVPNAQSTRDYAPTGHCGRGSHVVLSARRQLHGRPCPRASTSPPTRPAAAKLWNVQRPLLAHRPKPASVSSSPALTCSCECPCIQAFPRSTWLSVAGGRACWCAGITTGATMHEASMGTAMSKLQMLEDLHSNRSCHQVL